MDPDTDAATGATRPRTLADGRYRLLHTLGSGGMATVYRAYDTRLEVERAIKVLNPVVAAKPKLKARFDNEARTMARLHHPHIVTVHDVAEDGKTSFMVMEMLEGGSVMGWMERHGPLPPRMASDVMQAVLQALIIAHAKGVIHRDIKPHNILLTQDGVPKVTDFGIAQVRDGDRQVTKTGSVMGTWAYMAPEQKLSARKVDERSDVYACSATLYALLMNEEPFDLFSTEIQEDIEGRLPNQLQPIVRRGTRYRPEDRFATASEMLSALKEMHASLPAIPDGTPPLGGLVLPIIDPKVSLHEDSLTFDTDSHDPVTPAPKDARPGQPGVPPLYGYSRSQEIEIERPKRRWRFALAGLVGLLVLTLIAVGVAAALGAAGVAAVGVLGSRAGASPPPVTPVPVVVHAPAPEPAPPPEPEPVPVPAPPPATAAPIVDPPPVEPAPIARPRPKPAPIAVTPSGTGRLYVNSRPWSFVSVDGKPRVRTGWSGDVDYGKHGLEFTTEDGRSANTSVVVDAAEKRFCWDFAKDGPC